MTKQEFESWAESQGWKRDRWGHFQRKAMSSSGEIREYRLKLSRIAARHEVKASSGDWVRLRSGYFSKLSVVDGKLSGMER